MADYFFLFARPFWFFTPLILNVNWPIKLFMLHVFAFTYKRVRTVQHFLTAKCATHIPVLTKYTSTLDDACRVSLSALGHRVSCVQCKRARTHARTCARTHMHTPLYGVHGRTHDTFYHPYVSALLRIYWVSRTIKLPPPHRNSTGAAIPLPLFPHLWVCPVACPIQEHLNLPFSPSSNVSSEPPRHWWDVKSL